MPDTTLPSREGFPESIAATAWSLTVLHAPERAVVGRRFELGATLALGRDSEIDLADGKLSREHAVITRAGIVVEIRDLGSRNGTFVNGARVDARSLRPGDIVRVGDTLLELRDTPPRHATHPRLVGTAPVFLAAVDLADRVAASDLPVLILGETGTGKDLLAQHVHEQSGRTGAFVAVNCAALADELVESTLFGHKKGAFTGATADSPGMFLEARGGTLFLDEVGELDLAHQAKLLRALDAREILPVGATRPVHTDARVIAATNGDLTARIADGRFREDLYARLAGAVIRMPPLRARRGDILQLAALGLGGATLSGQAAERLVLHHWPRNVRELVLAMRRLALVLGDRTEVKRADLDGLLDDVTAQITISPELATLPAREELVAHLVELRGNVSRLAARYGKDAKQIYRWLKRYQLDPNGYR